MYEEWHFNYEWGSIKLHPNSVKSVIANDILELLKWQGLFPTIKKKFDSFYYIKKISVVFDLQLWDDTNYCSKNNHFTAEELGNVVLNAKGENFYPQPWNHLLVLTFEKFGDGWVEVNPRNVQILSGNSEYCCAKSLSLRDFYNRVKEIKKIMKNPHNN